MSSRAEIATTQEDAVLPTSSSSKTIFLIRHAESEENRRLGSMKASARALGQLSIPKSTDVMAALSWFNIPAQVDSNVSEIGRKQIDQMASILQEANFLTQANIEVVAHSPLERARATSLGLLGCMTPDHKRDPVQRVVELADLSEKSPSEWIPGGDSKFRKRMSNLEDWLRQQPERNIVLVGHSQYFKALLNLDFKFGNCDVWKVDFDGNRKEKDYVDTLPIKWSNLKKLHTCVPASENREE